MNTLRSVFVGVLLGVFAFGLFSPGPLSRQRVVASPAAISHVQDASVSIEVPMTETNLLGDVETGYARGSGVIFHRFGKTYVITAAHCVEGLPYHGEVTVQQGDAEWTAVLVSADHTHDVALLRLDSLRLVGTPAELSMATLPVGAKLLHVGNLLGAFPGSYLEGTLAALNRRSPDGGVFDQTNILAAPGSSGGGVFSMDGHLVGIIARGVYPGLCFMVPARKLLEWAEANDTQWLFESL